MTTRTEVLDLVKSKVAVGDRFTARDLKPKEEDLHSVQNALWVLSKEGYLDKPRGKGTRGIYVLRSRRNGSGAIIRAQAKMTNPAQAIYDLLDFMAKAEAPLKRAAKILEVVEGLK